MACDADLQRHPWLRHNCRLLHSTAITLRRAKFNASLSYRMHIANMRSRDRERQPAWPDRFRASHRGSDLALVGGAQSRRPKVHHGGSARAQVINCETAKSLGVTTGVSARAMQEFR